MDGRVARVRNQSRCRVNRDGRLVRPVVVRAVDGELITESKRVGTVQQRRGIRQVKFRDRRGINANRRHRHHTHQNQKAFHVLDSL